MNDKLKKFFSFEKDKKLFSRTYLGIAYWQSIRITFSSSAMLDTKIFSEKRSPSKFLPLLLKAGKDVAADILKYRALSKCDILYCDECAYRIIDGTTVDSYFDYFEFEKKYKVQRCFHIYNRQCKTSLKGIGTAIPKVTEHLLTLCSKMHLGNYKDEKEDMFLNQLAEDLEKEFHISFTAEELIQMVRRTVVIHRAYMKFYERLLMKCRPEAIFVVAHYSSYLYPLYNLAQRYSIPVIEIQHGLIVYHDAYWYEDTSATGKELPDYLFSYGSFWNKYISLPENMKIVPVGNPFLEERKEKYKNYVQDEKMMVFYSASDVAKEMENLAVEAWKRFGKKGFKIFFKVHPLDYDKWEEQYPLLAGCPQIQIISPDVDLYELLSRAKHHIAYASTVLYEATIFNNNRYLFDCSAFSEYMQPLIEAKLVYKFKTLEELEALLNKSMGTISDYKFEVWKKDAKRNGLEELREIMNE